MMHVQRYGTGPDVYFGLHGWGGSHLTYAPIVPLLPSSATFYSADLPGYGRSPRPATWSADAVGAEIAGAIRRVEAPGVTVVGNCAGAIFGLIAAALEPERVRRVVLIDPFAFVPWYFKVFVHPHYGRIAYRSTFANPIGRWITNASLKKHRASDSHLTDSFKAIDPEVSIHYLEMLHAIDGISRFQSVDAEIEIVFGERTFAAVKESVVQWQALWPKARQWQLPAGHLPIEEAPADLAGILFNRHQRAGAGV
jgi:pimeloyl-ACP methyl ester carboxylesterase